MAQANLLCVWTKKEVARLKEHLNEDLDKLVNVLPSHSRRSIYRRAMRLGREVNKKRGRGYKDPSGRVRYTYKGKRFYEHRLLMELFLRRKLKKEEVVHHIDMDPENNVIENLHLFKNGEAHSEAHRSLERLIKHLLKRRIIKFAKYKGIYEMYSI